MTFVVIILRQVEVRVRNTSFYAILNAMYHDVFILKNLLFWGGALELITMCLVLVKFHT